MSETAARNWFNGEETNELSIESLAKDIKEYVESKGRNFHLLFMVDEIGQYIGNNRSMLLNLQSLTEETLWMAGRTMEINYKFNDKVFKKCYSGCQKK